MGIWGRSWAKHVIKEFYFLVFYWFLVWLFGNKEEQSWVWSGGFKILACFWGSKVCKGNFSSSVQSRGDNNQISQMVLQELQLCDLPLHIFLLSWKDFFFFFFLVSTTDSSSSAKHCSQVHTYHQMWPFAYLSYTRFPWASKWDGIMSLETGLCWYNLHIGLSGKYWVGCISNYWILEPVSTNQSAFLRKSSSVDWSSWVAERFLL